jgi:hypothetical protein
MIDCKTTGKEREKNGKRRTQAITYVKRNNNRCAVK